MAKHLSGGERPPPNAVVRGLARVEGWVDAPPRWLRFAYPIVVVVAVVTFWQRRGWAGGLAAAFFFGSSGLTLFARSRAAAWSRRHPSVEGLWTGLILVSALVLWTRLSLWWCLLAGAAGLPLGLWAAHHRPAAARPGRPAPAAGAEDPVPVPADGQT